MRCLHLVAVCHVMLLTGLTLPCHRMLSGQGSLPLLAVALLSVSCAEAVMVPLGAPARTSIQFGPSCTSGLSVPPLEFLPSRLLVTPQVVRDLDQFYSCAFLYHL